MSLFGARGEGAAAFSTRLTGESFSRLPESGVLTCRIPRAPLVPGIYSANVQCTVNGEIEDWVRDAATLEVSGGAFFSTGRIPSTDNGFGAMVEHQWVSDQN